MPSASLLDEVDGGDHVPAQLPLIRKMVAESTVMTENIDQVLDSAEEMAALWAEDDE